MHHVSLSDNGHRKSNTNNSFPTSNLGTSHCKEDNHFHWPHQALGCHFRLLYWVPGVYHHLRLLYKALQGFQSLN